MAERVAQTIRGGGSVTSFHRGVLDACVPGRLREQLQHKHCYRVQAHGENFAEFARSIREAVRILGLGLPESEVVQMIFEGVTPQERSRLIFAERPRSYEDLEKMCVLSRAIQAIDESRGPVRASPGESRRVERRVVQSQPRTERNTGDRGGQLRGVVCFRCRRQGHVARDCTEDGMRPALPPRVRYPKN